MRKAGGYVTITSPTPSVANLGGRGRVELREGTFESDAFSCGHCNHIVHVPPRAHPNFVDVCRCCMCPICQKCSDDGKCDVIEKKLERMEARESALRSYGV